MSDSVTCNKDGVMENGQKELINESIELERNVARLYHLYARLFPDDHSFWWELACEEENHASLLRSGRDYYLEQGLFPREILCRHLSLLKETNKKICAIYDYSEEEQPDAAYAFNIAYWIETSAGEYHYQAAMGKEADSEMLRLFQGLNRDDKDHAERIRIAMEKRGIPVKDVA